MQKSSSLDQYKVPAFQRKRSLAAKARRKRVPATALEKRIAGIPVVKPKRRVAVRRGIARRSYASRRRAVSFEVENLGRERYSGDEGGFSSPLLPEGSLYTEEPVYSRSEGYSAESSELREMRLCGKIEGYISKIEVAIVTVKAPIRTGDRLIFESHEEGLFEQTLESMQINREDVSTAYSGDDVGMKVLAEPKKGGNVYKVV